MNEYRTFFRNMVSGTIHWVFDANGDNVQQIILYTIKAQAK